MSSKTNIIIHIKCKKNLKRRVIVELFNELDEKRQQRAIGIIFALKCL